MVSEIKDNSEMAYPLFRIKEIRYRNHTEFWCQKSIQFLGVHLYWRNTTACYHRTKECAMDELEDRAGKREIIIYIPSTKND